MAVEQDVWLRRSFVKALTCGAGLPLIDSNLTNERNSAGRPLFSSEQSTDYARLSIRTASDLIRRKVISPVELTRACLQRIERLNPVLNAFITVTVEQAMAQAREAEAEVRRGRSIAEVRTAGHALRVSQSLLTSVECGANLMDDNRIDD